MSLWRAPERPVRWFMRTSPAVEPAAVGAHRSLALQALLKGLHPEERPAVLDLGPPLSGNIKFLSALNCRVRVADVHRSLVAEPVEKRRPDAMPALLEALLPLAPDERFDAVLAWDVFDYLRKDQVTSLMMRLVPRFRRSAQMLVLVSMRRQLPAVPVRYRIVDGENLDCEKPPAQGASEPMRPCPQYKQSDLGHMMRGLGVRRCYLLRSGIQEYLMAPD
jgi:hypothetical protein